MKKLLSYLVLPVVLLGSLPATAANIEAPKPSPIVRATQVEYPKWVPPNADLVTYPLWGGRLATRDMAALGLHPMVLNYAWSGYNYSRKLSAFVADTLPAGTLVLADENGVPKYKEDCGNRLVAFSVCPKCDALPVPPPDAARAPIPGLDSKLRPAAPAPGSNDFSLGSMFWGLGKMLIALAALALALALITALVLVLYRWLRNLYDTLFPPPPPAPVVPVTATVTTPPLPPTAPSPTAPLTPSAATTEALRKKRASDHLPAIRFAEDVEAMSGANAKVPEDTFTAPTASEPSVVLDRGGIPAEEVPSVKPSRKFANVFAGNPLKVTYAGFTRVAVDVTEEGGVEVTRLTLFSKK